MKLRELIDLEVQLLRDEQAIQAGEEKTTVARDRAIGSQISDATGVARETATQFLADDRALRHTVCTAFLARLPADVRRSLPGTRIERGFSVIAWILFAVFFLSGLGAASATLHATDEQPVNVLAFIVIFMVVQIALLALYPVFVLVRKLRGAPGGTWLQRAIAQLGQVRWLDRFAGDTLQDLPETMHQLRLRKGIYGGVQQWILFTFVQRMALGFNFAALLASLYLVAFRDLPHCWSTTLDLEAATVHQWITWIGAPWSFLDGGVPTLEAVEYSRWITSENSGYVSVPDTIQNVDNLRRSWWRFLVAGLVTWGLLPRMLAWLGGHYCGKRTSERVPLNHMAVQHLFERLFPRGHAWSGPAPGDVRGDAPEPPKHPLPKPKPADPTAACYLVCWGTLHEEVDAVARHVGTRFQRPVKQAFGAGLTDVESEEQTVAVLHKKKARRIVIAMPEGQQPTKDVTRFLRTLRERLGTECELVVGILARTTAGYGDVDKDEIDAWRTRLLAEGDPYLTLQTMEATP